MWKTLSQWHAVCMQPHSSSIHSSTQLQCLHSQSSIQAEQLAWMLPLSSRPQPLHSKTGIFPGFFLEDTWFSPQFTWFFLRKKSCKLEEKNWMHDCPWQIPGPKHCACYQGFGHNSWELCLRLLRTGPQGPQLAYYRFQTQQLHIWFQENSHQEKGKSWNSWDL